MLPITYQSVPSCLLDRNVVVVAPCYFKRPSKVNYASWYNVVDNSVCVIVAIVGCRVVFMLNHA